MTRYDALRSIDIGGVRPFDTLDLAGAVKGLAAMWRCEYGGCPLHRADGKCYCSNCKKEIEKWLVAEDANVTR